MQRIHHDAVKSHDDGELDDQRQATAVRAEILTLIKLLDLLLHLLHRHLVVSTLVLISDRHFLRTKRCLTNRIFLLLDGKRNHQNLNHNCKETDPRNIVAKAKRVGDPAQHRTDRLEDRVKNPTVGIQVHRGFECIDQGINVRLVDRFKHGGIHLILGFRTVVCLGQKIFDSLQIDTVVYRGIHSRIVVALYGHIVTARGCNQHLLSIKIGRIDRFQHIGDLTQLINTRSVYAGIGGNIANRQRCLLRRAAANQHGHHHQHGNGKQAHATEKFSCFHGYHGVSNSPFQILGSAPPIFVVPRGAAAEVIAPHARRGHQAPSRIPRDNSIWSLDAQHTLGFAIRARARDQSLPYQRVDSARSVTQSGSYQ